jgi:hypothetical protein
MKIVCSLLFLNSATSNELAVFSDHKFDNKESECINFCCRYSYAVDDESLNIVLESPNITPSTAKESIDMLLSIDETLVFLMQIGSNFKKRKKLKKDTSSKVTQMRKNAFVLKLSFKPS